MRIRKNARVLELMLASFSYPIYQTTPHVCHLNQSPWDVVFQSSTNSTNNKLEGGECSLSGNASIESMKLEMVVPEEDHVDPNSSMGLDTNQDSSTQMVKKEIGNVKNNNDSEELKMSKKGNFSPQHHIKNNSNDSNNKNNNSSDQKSGKPIISGGVRRRGRPPGKKTLSTNPNPNEFYYYTGFGPLWAKRRGDNKISNVENTKEDSASSSSDEIEHDQNDVGKDVELMKDEEDSGGDNDNWRKRGRKPIKARSLKSLM